MNKHQDIHIHPGEILLEDVIKPAGVTIGEAADRLKVSRLTLSKILNGRGGITPNIALRLAVFGGKADFWLRLQRTYDLEEERRNLLLHPVHLEKFRYA
ncbi:HigA family addiction module antitoxin [Proteiniphilum sp.]|uniref:HigA family addiction module antitoxin n=1 Tax=Proteiniphilum sp. TaxID=1926877 RepID=UPI003321B467